MWSSICTYLYGKFFGETTTGQKRRIEDSSEHPRRKFIKLDNMNSVGSQDNFSEHLLSNEGYNESTICRDNEEKYESVIEPQKKLYNQSPMARKSIKSVETDSDYPTLDKERHHHAGNYKYVKEMSTLMHPDKEASYSKGSLTGTPPRSNNIGKPKSISDRIFIACHTSGTRRKDQKKCSPSFPTNPKKRFAENYPANYRPKTSDDIAKCVRMERSLKKNCEIWSYRPRDKDQYRQLLTNHLSRFNSFFSTPFKFPRPYSQKIQKPSIPVIDLTKEKSSLLLGKNHENLSRTSWCKTKDEVSFGSPPSNKKITRVNSLEEILRTNPVTSKNIAQEIINQHSKEVAEKRKLVELEERKVQVLSESNAKAYNDALEDRLRVYMRISEPAIDELPAEEPYELPDLTSEQEEKITSALKPNPGGQILIERFGLQIKRKDMQTLKGLNWLNDEVINFYMNLLMERGKEESVPKVYAFNTFFYPKLVSSGHSSLKRWTKKVDIFSYDMIVVPVHLGMHWCMALLDFRCKEVRYYDSMGTPNFRCLQSLLQYLEEESLDKKKTPYSTKDWEKINVEDIPQQMNGSDCGVFSCMFAEHLARDAPLLFSQDHMPYFRRKMVLEILEAKLIT